MGALEKNCFEHISMMAQEQIEVEFREEIMQLQQMQQHGATKSCYAAESAVPTTNNANFYES